MLGHYLRRFPNGNPTMVLNASCFFARKKHLPLPISRHVTRQLHPVKRIGSSGIASGGPALQTLGQH